VEDSPVGTVVSPDNNYVYVANRGSDSITKINTSTYATETIANVCDGPRWLDITSSGDRVYASCIFDNTVRVVQTATNSVISTISVGDHPGGIALTPNDAYAYVTNKYDVGSVSVIRTSNNTVMATVSGAFNDPKGVAVTSDSQYAYVANVDSSNVAVIRVSDNTVVATIGVSNDTHEIALSHANATTTVPLSNSVKVLLAILFAFGAFFMMNRRKIA
jgi:YVTN family beta-propeller protein